MRIEPTAISVQGIRNLVLRAILLLGLALFPASVIAQTTINPDPIAPQRGFYPGGSYALSDIETINTINGDLMFSIPLVSLPPGRAGFTAGIRLVYNSKLWDSTARKDWDPQIQANRTYRSLKKGDNIGFGGWSYGFQYELKDLPPDSPNCDNNHKAYGHRLQVTFPDGSHRQFHLLNPNGSVDTVDGFYRTRHDGMTGGGAVGSGCDVPITWDRTPHTFFSVDGTYLRLVVQPDSDYDPDNNPWTLYFPDGRRVTGGNSPQRFYDRNDNYVEVQNTTSHGHNATRLVDPFQRSITIEYGCAAEQDCVYASGFGGLELQWNIFWKTITVHRGFMETSDYPQYQENSWAVGEDFKVLDRIQLPLLPSQTTPLEYSFDYHKVNTAYNYGWGEVSTITIPSDASAVYTYSYEGDMTYSKWYSVLHRFYPKQKDLHYHLEYNNTTTEATDTWLYRIAVDTATLGVYTSEVQAPHGGITRTTFSSPFAHPSADYLVTKTETPDGKAVENLWRENMPYGFQIDHIYGSANPFVKTQFTTVTVGNQQTAIKDSHYDKNGNVTQTSEYDWTAAGSVPRDGNGYPTGLPSGLTTLRGSVQTYFTPTGDAEGTPTNDPNAYHLKTSDRALLNALTQQEVASASQTVSHSEYIYDNGATTGNLLQESRWDSTKGALPLGSGNSVTISHQYSTHGNLKQTTDGNGNVTQWSFDSNDLYPVTINNALGSTVHRTTSLFHDFSSGLVTQRTDVDNTVATNFGYDLLGRPTLVDEAAGDPSVRTQTVTEYKDPERIVIVKRDLDATSDGKLVTVQHYDQLGRLRLSRQLEDSSTQSVTDETAGIKVQPRYAYSGSNRYLLTSNPYRASTSNAAGGESTMGWTLTKMDTADRTIAVQYFSGSGLPAPWGGNGSSTGTVTTTYNGIYTTVADPAGKARRSKLDGVGRLVEVVEDPNGTPLTTSYTYDALSNLTVVTQGNQTPRSFNFSSLSRLTSAYNPESGSISYLYDSNGNLTRRTDSRSSTRTDYVYDALNRVTNRNYTIFGTTAATPNVTYTYGTASAPCGTNSKGRLCSVSSSVSETDFFDYDALGRVLHSSQKNPVDNSRPFTFSYTYNRADGITSMTYPSIATSPSPRVITTTYDSAGRINGLAGQKAGEVDKTYDSSFSYSPHGALRQMKLGNNLWEDSRYNTRLQPVQIGLGQTQQTGLDSLIIPSANVADKLLLDLCYSGTDSSCTNQSTSNNGNLLQQRIRIAAVAPAPALDLTQSYVYNDPMNRLTNASETPGSGSAWPAIAYGMDRYGNRWVASGYKPNPNLAPQSQSEFDASTNRMVSPSVYDNSGNLITDKVGHTFRYDAENRQVEFDPHVSGVAATTYQYDGDGRRVRKSDGTIYVYDAMGQLAAEYNGQPSGSGTSFLTADHLGSTRLVTDRDQNVKTRHDYLPYGEEIDPSYGNRSAIAGYTSSLIDGPSQKFTAKERDNESGLDYFGARYFSGAQGRFTSPDPVIVTPARMLDPQRFNLYAYARDNPFKFIDPNGEDIDFVNDTEVGRKKALALITENLKANEAANIGFRQKKDGSYEAYVINEKAVGKDSSKGYKDLVGLINDRSIVADVGVIGGGLTATFSDLGTVRSWSRGDSVFPPAPGSKHVDVLVTQGDLPGGTQVWCCNGKAVYQGRQPDFVTMWHELIGETLKYRAGHQNLLRDSALDSRTVIKIENEIRAFHDMNPRTGEDHGQTVLTVHGKVE